MTNKNNRNDLAMMTFACAGDWTAWLADHHATSPGIWLQIAKKASGIASATYEEALDEALCYGWIDGQRKRYDDAFFLQKFTPRGARSIWSKRNRAKVEQLIQSGRMMPAGMEAVEAARQDGRWDDAYDSPANAQVPADLQGALDGNPQAKEFFATLNKQNQYAILFRLQTAKKAETRQRRLDQFIAMLARHEKLHP